MSAPALVAVAAATLALGLTIAGAAPALYAAQRAAGAADAAALAAADAESGFTQGEPCALAASIAAATDVSLERCDVDRASGQVRVSVSVQTILGTAHARARAGPPVA